MSSSKTYTLGKPTSAWLATELDGNHRPSRENKIVAPGQTLKDGMVVGYDEDSHIVQISASNTNAVGIFVGDTVTTASNETGQGVIIARAAKVVGENLVFPDGLTVDTQAQVFLALAQLDITLVRSA
ncbi:head decoration protein [Acinetobacter rathckeae]|uniref:head decoration protein n=1 Tax=Acinetobacter rathckeae TaxID=2605272 RepID=UPI0018A2CCEA|nr:head decoration protein [Acinetobacter rathckeae]MBF7696627.1 head decoration protein [Acinetobacter rathckeae]